MKQLWYGVLAIVIAGMLIITQPLHAQKQRCDPSYPTVCIAPPKPDLDCKDVAATNFKVLQPDPHKFDREKDGIGCEV